MKTVTYKTCGWVSIQITRAKAMREVREFNRWYRKQTPERQESYGSKPASLKSYRCQVCGENAQKNFRPAEPGDCPDGCTLSAVVLEK